MASIKLQNIMNQIDRGETMAALTEINNYVGKEKNVKKMLPEEIISFKFIKAVCLVRSQEGYGEAKEIFEDILVKNWKTSNIITDLPIIESIALPIKLMPAMREFIEDFYKKQDQNDDNLKRHLNSMMKSLDFDAAQKIANKLYTTTQEKPYLFLSIFLQTLNKNKKPNYMILQLFLDKVKQVYEIDQPDFHEKITKIMDKNPIVNVAYYVIQFQTQIWIEQKKYKEAFEYIQKHYYAFEQNLVNIKLLTQLIEEDKENIQQYLQVLMKIFFQAFKQNTNIEQFVMIFETYKNCIDFIFAQLKNQNISEVNFTSLLGEKKNNELELLAKESPFDFDKLPKEISDDILNNLYKILAVFYFSLNQHQEILYQKNNKHHHFKNCLKAVLQSKMRILVNLYLFNGNKESEQFYQELQQILAIYIQNFSQILTFPDELFTTLYQIQQDDLTKQLYPTFEKEIGIPEEQQTKQCIKHFNKVKTDIQLFGKTKVNSLQYFNNISGMILSFYQEYFDKIYEKKEKKVEKGERLWNDDFLIIFSDMAWEIISKFDKLEKEQMQLIYKVIAALECGFFMSEYNFDIAMRLMKYYTLTKNFQRMIEIYKTQDIKGIQFDTLGFLFLNFGLTNQMADYSEIQDLVVKALSYYAENLRECKMSMSTAIKNNNFDQLKEVIEWDSWVDRSYLRLLYNFLKYQNQTQILNKKGLQYDLNTDYFLEQITEGLKDQKNLTFNIDMKQIQPIYANILNKDSQFYKNFVGGYQNFNYLKFHVQRQKLQKILFRILNNSERDEELSKEGQEILEDLEKNVLPQIKVENAYDLSGFSLYNKPEHLTKYSHNQNNDLQAKNINQIYQLDLQYFSIENQITKFLFEMTKFGAKTLDLIVNLEQIFDKIKLEIGKIFEQFNQDIDQLNLQQVVFPFELHQNLNKFYQDTFRFLQIFSLQSETVKSKLSKFSKKPSKEKKQITAVLKSFLAFFPDLQEQSNTLAQKLQYLCDKYCADYLDKNSKNEDNLYNLIKISNEEKALNTQNGKHISIGDVFNKIEQISFSKVIDQTLYEKSKLNYSFLLKNLVQLVKAQGKEIVILK